MTRARGNAPVPQTASFDSGVTLPTTPAFAIVLLLLLAATGMAACSGGGGGASGPTAQPTEPLPETKPCPDGSRIPVDQECPPVVEPPEPPQPPDTKLCPDGSRVLVDQECPPVVEQPEPRGALAVPGIERIPLSAIRMTNQQLARQFAVTEYDTTNSLHAREVRAVACHSYITGCKNPNDLSTTPFSFYSISIGGLVGDEETVALLAKIPSTVKIISLSIAPMGRGPINTRGASLPFVVVQGAGNDSNENFFHSGVYSPDNPTDVEWRKRILAAAAADKVLYVAGHYSDDPTRRASGSTGCTGMDDACLYAPFGFLDVPGVGGVAGTSFSTPNVAAALASVLAVFPSTEGTELIRLAKACAVSVPTLSGLGRADFSCMTKMDNNGQWRVLTNGEFNSLIAPSGMQQMRFPGRTRVVGTFGRPTAPSSGSISISARKPQTVRLGITHQGSFNSSYFTAGVPVNLSGEESGFFSCCRREAGQQRTRARLPDGRRPLRRRVVRRAGGVLRPRRRKAGQQRARSRLPDGRRSLRCRVVRRAGGVLRPRRRVRVCRRLRA